MPEDRAEAMQRVLQSAPALKNLPKGTQVCVIQKPEGLLLYNINEAFRLIEGRTANATVNVREVAAHIQPRGKTVPEGDDAEIDPAHAETVDLSYPVILLERREGDRVLIDGNHRVFRAAQLGIDELPAFLLSPEDEALIRIPLEG